MKERAKGYSFSKHIHECYTSPPCVLRTALVWPCVLRTAMFSVSRNAYRLTTKQPFFGVSIKIKKIKWQSGVCTCRIILANVSFVVFDFLVFDLPKSMFKFINAELTLKSACEARARKNNVIWLCMLRLFCFLMKMGPFKSKKWCLRTI